MDRVVRIFALSVMILPAMLSFAGQDAPPQTDVGQTSYAMGVDMARNFKKQGVEIDTELLLRGLKDGYAGKVQMSDKDVRRIMVAFQNDMRQRLTLSRRQAADDNRTRGTEFLGNNKNKQGVVALPSGLQYKVIDAGTTNGRHPTEGDLIEVNYRGTTLSGVEFDATEPGKPATLKVGGLISGWREALKQMPVGAKWQIFIPPQLAYGERGAGSDIGPNETLIFEVELVAIK
jgi:FKBP-type peptidyl-prolyl cis-trans isomerase